MIVTKRACKTIIAPLNRLGIKTFADAYQQGLITAKECTEFSTKLGNTVPTPAMFRAYLKDNDAGTMNTKTQQMFNRLSPSRKVWVMGN